MKDLSIHHIEDGLAYECQLQEAKTKAFKAWCPVCKRYVLQDTVHKLRQLYALPEDYKRLGVSDNY